MCSDPLIQSDVIVTYRELAPAPALRGHVRAYFTFTRGLAAWSGQRRVLREVAYTRNDSFCSPVVADGHASVVVDLGATCRLGSGWTGGGPVGAHVMGALRSVGDTTGVDRPEMLGVFLEPGSAWSLLHVPAVELTDHVVNLEHIWGARADGLVDDLAELDDASRVDRLEALLLERLHRASVPWSSVDSVGLARWVRAKPTSLTVRDLADAAGVSRQHLTRVFRQVVGVSPKRYCRLARFQAGLVYAGAGPGVSWARVAAELGYADQSHMIAEFRELSSLTPEALANQRWFHPFILQAKGERRTAETAQSQTPQKPESAKA
jgi:AraC-like DNA-binding protein